MHTLIVLWMVALFAAFLLGHVGSPLNNVPYPHRGQQKVLKRRKRFNVVACGRRWGKTTFILILIMLAVADNLLTGKTQDIAFVGINKKNYSPIWNTIKALLKSRTTAISNQETTLRVNDQFNIEFWSMEALTKTEGARGRAYRLMVIDEMGSLPNFKAVWQAVLYATLNDYRGEAWFCGTPKGFNDFQEFSEYCKHPFMKDYWTFYTAKSIENPNFTEEEWLLAKAQLTDDYFRQEYEAEFIALGNNLFDKDDFGRIDELPDLTWKCQLRYWDIANSLKGDYTASIRLNVDANSPIVVLDRPRRFRGRWGQTYPSVKGVIKSEPETVNLIETEGIGSMAYEFVMQDISTELNGFTVYEAGRQYTSKSKWDRANGWAMKSKLKEFYYVNSDPVEDDEFFKQIPRFPFYKNDEYVDSISGGHLGVIYLYDGFNIGKNPFIIGQNIDKIVENVFLESVILTDFEKGLIKYEGLIHLYNDDF